IVLLWMVANDAFNNFAEKSNNLSPFNIKEIIEFSSNIEDSNYIDRLRPPPLTDYWKLRDSKSRRRASIMELGYLLTKKIIGLDFNIEDITFT
ncbi:20259_t:CDS:2, partial [Cetraspora pellucida]